jgi:hypothetical protein
MKTRPFAEGALRSVSSLCTFLFRSLALTSAGAMRQMLLLTPSGRSANT